VWLHKAKNTNLRHQTQTPFCHFFAVSVCRWGRVPRLPVGKVAFTCYSRSSRSFLICLAWEQYKLAQVLYSNLISEWLCWRKFKLEKSHLKISIELYAIQTLTKLQHCSVTKETTMLLLQDTAASPTHSSYLQYNLALIRCSDVTRGLSQGET